MASIGVSLLVYGLDFLQQTVLLHFLMVKEVPKQMLIIQLQKNSEAHLGRVISFFSRVIEEEPFIE